MNKLAVLVTILMVGPLSNAVAQSVLSYPVPGQVLEDQTGPLNVLHAKVVERAGVGEPLKLFPVNRSIAAFNSGDALGLMPLAEDSAKLGLIKDPDVLLSSAFVMAIFYPVIRQGDEYPTTLADLHGKRVAINDGYIYTSEFINDKEINFEQGPGDEAGLKKLLVKRVDVAFVEAGAVRTLVEKIGADKLYYDPERPLLRHKVVYMFQNTPEGKAMRDKFSVAIDSLKDDGTLAQIFGPAAP